MTETPHPQFGQIIWFDLTVPDAERVRDFYQQVVGWIPQNVDVGGYNDYNMTQPGTGKVISGICHARGVNQNLPPQWMIYITVEDLDASIKACEQLGGKVLSGPNGGEGMRMCVIQDPAGAVAALMEQKG